MAHSTIINAQGEIQKEDVLKIICEIVCKEKGCLECDLCQRIIKDEYQDILHILHDTKKEEIDQLVARFSQRSIEEFGFKVAVFYEAEKLSNIIVNSILKFIEEPPKDTYFIFITNNEIGIIDTIRSRSVTLNKSFFDNFDSIDIIDKWLNKEPRIALSIHSELKEFKVNEIKKSLIKSINTSKLDGAQTSELINIISEVSNNINKSLFIDKINSVIFKGE